MGQAIPIFASILVTLATGVVLAAEPAHGEFPAEKIEVGGVTREYRLVVPKSVALDKPAPIVFAFHGILIDSKDVMPLYTKLNDAASKHKFILVYPDALDKSWGIAPDKVKKDLEFFDALLKELQTRYKIDSERIYAVGMSNGGYFTHIVGRERSKTVAAIASHSGVLGLETLAGIRSERKFPVMIVHGDKDKIFPVDWARENRDKYTKAGHEVKYVEVAGLGHFWATNADINDAIWAFFAEHPLKMK